jgi:hypothetical protein
MKKIEKDRVNSIRIKVRIESEIKNFEKYF